MRETVAILKQAGLSPIEVTGHGTIEERLAEGHEIPEEERVLMDRALAENAVISTFGLTRSITPPPPSSWPMPPSAPPAMSAALA